MANPLQFPLVNGNRYAWSSVRIQANGQRYVGVKGVNYSQEVAPGEVYGTHAQKIGRTRGEVKPEASIELYKEEFDALINDLGDGFYEVEFEVVVSFDESGRVITDQIHSCRIKKPDSGHSQGPDALTVKVDLDVMWIEYSGKKPLKTMVNGIV